MFEKILKYLFILQEVDNKNKIPKLGRGFSKAYRLNPYNPFSYISLIIFVTTGIILYGIIGFWEKEELRNPFKWD